MDQNEIRNKRMRLFGRPGEDDAPPAFDSPNNSTDHATTAPSEMSVDTYLTGDVMDNTPEAHAVRAMPASLTCARCKEVARNTVAHFDKSAHTTGKYVQHDCNCAESNGVVCLVLLAGFDCNTKHNKVPRGPPTPQMAKPSRNAVTSFANLARGSPCRQANGIGYGGDDERLGGDGEQGWRYQYDSGKRLGNYDTVQTGAATPQSLIEEDDRLVAGIMGALASLLGDSNHSSALPTLLYRSSILDQAADLLVNTSVDNIISRAALYIQLFAFICALAKSPTAAAVLYTSRQRNKAGHNIHRVAMVLPTLTSADTDERARPLAQYMVGLGRQHALMASNAQVFNHYSVATLCVAIKDAADAVEQANPARLAPSRDVASIAEAAVAGVPSHTVLGNLRLRNPANGMGSNLSKNRNKCIVKDLINLAGSLPDGIFVRYGEDRPDCMKILIVAPKGTPYENGLFEFDLLCPSDYPQSPPQMLFRTTGKGTFYFNPNLYADGTVCLSLLNTWETGTPWTPGESTILQVLVSIQAMIFCDYPWSNEPGREGLEDSAQSKAYNRSLHPKTVEFAMLDWLEGKGNNIWHDVVVQHFQERQEEILETVGKWKDDTPSSQPAKKNKGKQPAGPFSGLQAQSGQFLQSSEQALGGSGLSLSQDDGQDDEYMGTDMSEMTAFSPPPPSAHSPPKKKAKYSPMPFGSGHSLGGSGIPFDTTSLTQTIAPFGYANPHALTGLPSGYGPAPLASLSYDYTPPTVPSLAYGYPSGMYPSYLASSALPQPPPAVPTVFPVMPDHHSAYQGTGWAGQKLGGEVDARGGEQDDSLADHEETEQEEKVQQGANQEEASSELAEFAVKLRQAVKGLSSKDRLGTGVYSPGGDWDVLDFD
ncbi:hypothetical protein DOTSEDRAFT_52255 [Dothistroma septosporum NZE10]|uniref:UBC core domain-containing protein n=1 Tax=Dothistroma septosporum (strain NZE10 / CBS 128990) TaxID=675120 RepID=N1PTZ3_DOTSN|nr:hypothetical protein DOTSEDRAFT_52255 [Dothistroma septosporum NZE10]